MTSLASPFRSPHAVVAMRSRETWKAPGIRKLPRLVRLWLDRHAWRKELAALDAEQMRDCGFNPVDVRIEATKPFWRA
jgi:uncharacterized protein YjiS (DUF1127 family)